MARRNGGRSPGAVEASVQKTYDEGHGDATEVAEEVYLETHMLNQTLGAEEEEDEDNEQAGEDKEEAAEQWGQ